MTAKTFATAALITGLVVAASGCGSQVPATGAPATSEAPASGAPPSEAATQRGVLRVATDGDLVTFNPFSEGGGGDIGSTLNRMLYPALGQFTFSAEKGYGVEPDLATTREVSDDGKTWTYHLVKGATWSDGEPLDAEDAAWTINTTVKFADGPAGIVASLVTGVVSAKAVDPTTLVVEYSAPIAGADQQLAQLLIVPPQVFEPLAAGDGEALRLTPITDNLVTAGPYVVKQWEQRGTTILVADPRFYGEPSNAEAVAVTYYTSSDAMLEDLQNDKVDFVSDVPFTAADAIQGKPGIVTELGPGSVSPILWFNHNPFKPQNRELLDGRVVEALAMCIDYEQIVNVVFGGYAVPTSHVALSAQSGEYLNPDIAPIPFDCAAANRQLDELGYKRGADGIRVVPATTGEYAQPEHPMAYPITEHQARQFNPTRLAQILIQGWETIGVEATENMTGDEGALVAYLYGSDCDWATHTGYSEYDLWLGVDFAEISPLDDLDPMRSERWCSRNFSGYANPEFDRLLAEAQTTADPDARKDIIWQLQEIVREDMPAIPLVEPQGISAHSSKWTDFVSPLLYQYSKRYFTAPRLTE